MDRAQQLKTSCTIVDGVSELGESFSWVEFGWMHVCFKHGYNIRDQYTLVKKNYVKTMQLEVIFH